MKIQNLFNGASPAWIALTVLEIQGEIYKLFFIGFINQIEEFLWNYNCVLDQSYSRMRVCV